VNSEELCSPWIFQGAITFPPATIAWTFGLWFWWWFPQMVYHCYTVAVCPGSDFQGLDVLHRSHAFVMNWRQILELSQ
jgi:hypothetical protein